MILKQETEFHTSQSKIRLQLSSSQESVKYYICFSSEYQLQDWIDLMDRTKQELIHRSSPPSSQTSHTQNLTHSIIQKRLDFIKPNLQEYNTNEVAPNVQMKPPTETYSGTLCITIHSMHGPALCNPSKQYGVMLLKPVSQDNQNNYQFVVLVHIIIIAKINSVVIEFIAS